MKICNYPNRLECNDVDDPVVFVWNHTDFLALVAAGILWAIRTGQYDDLEGPAQRILMDDDDPKIPFNQLKSSSHLNPQSNQNNIQQ